MKIAFAGTPEIAATILQSIIDKKDLLIVVGRFVRSKYLLGIR